jgi:hypothetical protein
MPSRKPANNNKALAVLYSPMIEKRMAVKVKHKLEKVITLGNVRNKE